MDKKKLIEDYLKNERVMQLATTVGNQPWLCNVHFYTDEHLNMYWVSNTTSRHSQEIAQNPKAATTIKIHEDTPEEKYLICVSVVGEAEVVSLEETKTIGPDYIKKLGRSPGMIENILAGTNTSKMYRLKPSTFVLFDTKNFPENPRQEFIL